MMRLKVTLKRATATSISATVSSLSNFTSLAPSFEAASVRSTIACGELAIRLVGTASRLYLRLSHSVSPVSADFGDVSLHFGIDPLLRSNELPQKF